MSTGNSTGPEQAWAHKDGRVDLGPQVAIPTTHDPLDRMAIAEAFYRFGIAHDEARLDVLESCFTGDAILEVIEAGRPQARFEGREALLAGVGSVIAQQDDQRRHCITNVVTDRLEGDEARAVAYGLVAVADARIDFAASVIYSADLRREDDRVWRFARLMIGMDLYVGKKPELDG